MNIKEETRKMKLASPILAASSLEKRNHALALIRESLLATLPWQRFHSQGRSGLSHGLILNPSNYNVVFLIYSIYSLYCLAAS